MDRWKNRFPVIVFGTTPDYVERLFSGYPNDLLFILDRRYQESPFLKDVNPRSIIFADLENSKNTISSMKRHFSEKGIVPRGMACFDCESLLAASEAADDLGLRFPPEVAIRNARNKFISKRIWHESGISTPIAGIASSLKETVDFYRKCNEGIVLKPLSGSGSELVFYCRNEQEISQAVEILFFQLEHRMDDIRFRMEQDLNSSFGMDTFRSWVAEEYISGPEYSCDFVLCDDNLTILRTSGKIKDEKHPFGTILAYTLPAFPPPEISQKDLAEKLKVAVSSLGFDWGWFMVDFMVHDKQPVILEISPRPGGDSLPDLIEFASGIDILHTYLNMVSGNCDHTEEILLHGKTFASVNLFASENGWIKEIDITAIEALNYVHKVFITREINDRIVLPPSDYDSWKIGYCIVSADYSTNLIGTQEELQKRMILDVKKFPDRLSGLKSA